MMKKLNDTMGWDFVHETIDGVETPPSGIVSLDLRLEGIEERLAVLEGQEGIAGTGAFGSIMASFNDILGWCGKMGS